MKHINSDTRLTDSLERQLMARAIEEQMRFKPGAALKSFFSSLSAKFARDGHGASGETAQSAS